MKKRTKINSSLFAISFALLTIVSCSSDNEKDSVSGNTTKQKFFVAATQGTATYMLTVDDLESGTATIVGNGIEEPYSFTAFVNNGTASTVAMQYRQGDPALGLSYGLDSAGKLVRKGNEFQMTVGYTTWGAFDKYVITARSGQTLTDGSVGAIFYLIDPANQNAVTEKSIKTGNLTGNGLPATLSGIADAGNGNFFTSLVLTGGNPDEVNIASIDANMNVKQIFTDNRISYSAGRYRSAYYSQIANDDDGNTYVFSGAFDSTTTKPAGALRINKSATSFDKEYYFNIQELSGGFRFRKVWHITDDYFLLELYNTTTYTTMTPATQYAIVKMKDKKLTWITTGFPAKEDITATGWPFAYNGKMYFPVTTANAKPTVYVIDPKAGTAKAGLVIDAAGISALSRFTY
jgi:hypothetical protein